MSIRLPVLIGTPDSAVDSESTQVLSWHRRGQSRFVIGLFIMLAANLVTGTAWPAATITLVGAGLVVSTIRFLLVSAGAADRRWTLLLWPLPPV